jgi:hypothetical protein
MNVSDASVGSSHQLRIRGQTEFHTVASERKKLNALSDRFERNTSAGVLRIADFGFRIPGWEMAELRDAAFVLQS